MTGHSRKRLANHMAKAMQLSMQISMTLALLVAVAGKSPVRLHKSLDVDGEPKLHKSLALESPAIEEDRGLSLQPGGLIATYVVGSTRKLAKDLQEEVDEWAEMDASSDPNMLNVLEGANPWFLCKAVISGAFLGTVFGMMGAGGSLILKPLLYYGFEVRPFKDAIFHGYIILFLVATVGTVKGQSKGLVNWRNVTMLACLTSGLGACLGSLLASMVSSQLQLLCFSILILGVALHMLHESNAMSWWIPTHNEKCKDLLSEEKSTHKSSLTCVSAVLVGVISGFTGIGGGFLLVPLLGRYGQQMETAVPTSQAVVALSCLFGSIYYISILHRSLAAAHFSVIICLVLPGLAGVMLTDYIGKYVSKVLRQQLYASMLISVGAGTLIMQIMP